MIRVLLSGLKYLLLTILLLGVAYTVWSMVAYRDLSEQQLVERYGGDNLHHADIDGVKLYYRLDGQPLDSAPVLLLIHSHYFNSSMWDGWVNQLADDFALIRFDMTSHGLTGPEPNGDYSMTRDLELIEGLFGELGVESVAIAGSSLGGNMAFHYAAEHPEQVSHLLLINSGGLKRKQSGRRNAAGIPDWFHRVFYFVPEMAYRRFLEWMVVDDTLITAEFVREFHAMFRRSGNREAEMARMRSFNVGEPDGVLAKVQAPTLILWGAENPQLPATQVERFFGKLSAAQSVTARVYPHAGHLLPVELPTLSANDARHFIFTGSLSPEISP